MNLSQLCKTRKRYLCYYLATVLLSYIFFEAFSTYFTLAYTVKGQECFPYRFWLIRKGVIPGKDSYVYFKNPRFGARSPTPERWVKMIYGAEGDRIEVDKIPEGQRPGVFDDELGRPHAVQAYVSVYRKDTVPPRILEAFEKDTKERPLPLIEQGIIPKGKYFVMADALRSFDSRYWGLIDGKEILGRAYPIF